MKPPSLLSETDDWVDEGWHGDVARGARDGVAAVGLGHAEQASIQSRRVQLREGGTIHV